jgi:hypothetical protein
MKVGDKVYIKTWGKKRIFTIMEIVQYSNPFSDWAPKEYAKVANAKENYNFFLRDLELLHKKPILNKLSKTI